MVPAMVSRFIVLAVGTLFPAYKSYKAVRTKDVREYVKWMMYWIVFALFLTVEVLADMFISFWFPLYNELKIVFVIWLMNPYTKGASTIYRKFVHPTLSRHEDEIDDYIDKARKESYSTLLRLGSQGILYARDAVATAVVRGQGQLIQQLRKSYSMSDISQDDMDLQGRPDGDGHRLTIHEIQEEEDEDYGDGQEAEHRVWSGYYDGGRVVEEEFQYLEEEEALDPEPPRRSTRRRRQPETVKAPERFNTLPRAARGAAASRRRIVRSNFSGPPGNPREDDE